MHSISVMTISHEGATAAVKVTNFHSSYSPGAAPGDKVRRYQELRKQLMHIWHLSPAPLLPET